MPPSSDSTNSLMDDVATSSRVSAWRDVLPREHGSWALALEPLLLAMIVAPSWPGVALVVASSAAFFVRRPLRRWWSGRRSPVNRNGAGVGMVVLMLGLAGSVATVAAIASAGSSLMMPLGVALLTGVLFLASDLSGGGRAVAAELSGGAVFAAMATSIVLAGDAGSPVALIAGGFCLGRAWLSILPIRTYVRRRKGEAASGVSVVEVSLAAVVAAWGVGVLAGEWILFVWMSVFSIRSCWLLGSWAPHWTARRIGVIEAVLGVLAVTTTGLALR